MSQGYWQQIVQQVGQKRRIHLKYLIVIGYCLFLFFGLANVCLVHAKDADSDEYNFGWLDPDKKITVLQNRKYSKAGHGLLSLMAGVGFSNPFRSTYNFDPRFAYYFNETFGIEGFYTLTSNSENNYAQALLDSTGNGSALPQIREIRSQYGGMIHYVPWYAKINVYNTILYFDWYFGIGAGMIQSYVDTRSTKLVPPSYVQQDLFSIFFSTGHHYHLSQNFLIRIDLTGAVYSAPIYGTSGESAWYSNLNFGLGLGWKL